MSKLNFWNLSTEALSKFFTDIDRAMLPASATNCNCEIAPVISFDVWQPGANKIINLPNELSDKWLP